MERQRNTIPRKPIASPLFPSSDTSSLTARLTLELPRIRQDSTKQASNIRRTHGENDFYPNYWLLCQLIVSLIFARFIVSRLVFRV